MTGPDTPSESGFFDWADYRLFFFSKKNDQKSANNEDVVFARAHRDRVVLGVCDGVGGNSKGKEAAQLAATGILKTVGQERASDGNLFDALENINGEIRGLKVGAATTLCFGAMTGDEIRFFSIGDSEIYYTNNRGGVVYHNIAHSPVAYGVESGLIEQEDSLDDPDRNIILNFLGDEILRFETSSKISLKRGHSVLIGSDGLFDNFPQKEIVSIMAAGNFDQAAEKLKEICDHPRPQEQWKDDDISFIYMRRMRA